MLLQAVKNLHQAVLEEVGLGIACALQRDGARVTNTSELSNCCVLKQVVL
jgi:hypothetical protein